MVVTARSPQTRAGIHLRRALRRPRAERADDLRRSRQPRLVSTRCPPGTEATNLQVQQYGGKPVLTWWQGYIPPQGFGEGEEVIADSSYQADRPGPRGQRLQGRPARLPHHARGDTALLTVFNPIDCDLSSVGGPSAAAVTDTAFQEIDLDTGLVRREWHSLDHVALGDSYSRASGVQRANGRSTTSTQLARPARRREDADLGAQHLGAV